MERNRLKEMQITEESGMELRSEVKQTATTGSRNEDTSEVFYLDNVDFGNITPNKILMPRFLKFTKNLISTLEKEDKEGLTQTGVVLYGRNQILEDDTVIYSRNEKNKENSTKSYKKMDKKAGEGIDELMSTLNIWEKLVIKKTNETNEAINSCLQQIWNDYQTDHGGATKEDYQDLSLLRQGITKSSSDSNKKEEDIGTKKEQLQELCYTLDDEMIKEHESSESMGENEGSKITHNEVLLRKIDYWLYVNEEEKGESWKIEEEEEKDNESMETVENSEESTSMDTGTCQQLRIEVIKKLKEMGIELEVLNQYSPDDEMKQRQQEEIECPTPLLVVKPAIQQQLICCKDKETEEEGRHSLINNDNRMVIQYITQETRFGISPFALGMTHQDALVEGQLALQMVLREVRAKDMMRTWYVHMFPDEIQIRGKLLKQIFQGEADIDTTMEAVVRLYTELDNDMYSKWNGKRWRHFLPTEFAVWALNNERTETTMRIKEMFSSTFIDYKVADCRLVMVPVMVHWHWTLYVWDFKRNTVVILDPRGKEYDIHYMEHKHNKTFKMIHSAMQECHEKFLNESSNYMEDWGVQYITINGGQTESFDSGLYTMFSAKYFDGEIVTRLLTKEALQLQRVNLLYQILTMKGNIGTAPKGIEAALSL